MKKQNQTDHELWRKATVAFFDVTTTAEHRRRAFQYLKRTGRVKIRKAA